MIFRLLFRRIPLFAGLLVASTVASFSQDEESKECLLDRFSLTVATSYHFRPWKEFNTWQNRWNDDLRYDPYYVDPHGKIETISGDVTFELGIIYKLFDDVHLRGVYHYLRTGASSDVHYATGFSGYSTSYASLHRYSQSVKLYVHSVGLGVDYTIRLGTALQLQLYTVGTLNFGDISSSSGYYYIDTDKYIVADTDVSEMRGNNLGSNSGITLSWPMSSMFSLSLSGNYRYLIFYNFEGREFTTSNIFPAHTYEACLWGITGNVDEVLDLRSLGLKFGVTIGL